jgi:mono/diheme cytochrome c family protein
MLFSLFSITLFWNSCSDGDQQKGESINNGMNLFVTNCSACHQKDGLGLAQLYPPLKNSSYFKVNYAKLPCIIRNGLKGSITVNGNTYDQYMPGIASLTPAEIADISNYVMNNFNSMNQYTKEDEVSKTLASCTQ